MKGKGRQIGRWVNMNCWLDGVVGGQDPSTLRTTEGKRIEAPEELPALSKGLPPPPARDVDVEGGTALVLALVAVLTVAWAAPLVCVDVPTALLWVEANVDAVVGDAVSTTVTVAVDVGVVEAADVDTTKGMLEVEAAELTEGWLDVSNSNPLLVAATLDSTSVPLPMLGVTVIAVRLHALAREEAPHQIVALTLDVVKAARVH
ncbi:hypothetical protein B0A49_07338 [Cryomyces minteri]|uniref:Uncharacterized protein n=1 Tax=Cryomyces minteri TaxID=331657 RepID=A0A4U0X363_9PEZI|nr:hypothetical protein B0A49_07338 [Cryomyces minteri]